MKIFINQKEHQTEKELLADILAEISLKELNGIAIAVNNEVISRTNWQTFLLKEEDKIIIIRATQGG